MVADQWLGEKRTHARQFASRSLSDYEAPAAASVVADLTSEYIVTTS